MTTEQKDLIKATVPVLKEHGVLLTTHFYKRMFEHNPELKNMFNMGNQQNGKQQTALAMAVLAYAENIEDPSVLFPVVNSIGHKHTSLDIRPEHYLIVGKHLIASISEVLGDDASSGILEAWTLAYNQLAALMQGHESKLYTAQVEKKGGWSGWRPFLVKRKERESAEVTSFYLYPADGGPVADFFPGQYLSVRLFIPQLYLLQARQYSISSAPNGEYYRISVKREEGAIHPSGLISNILHDAVAVGDKIDVSAPAGSFVLNATGKPHAVFVSGGIGQTPLICMLEHLMAEGDSKAITWIHGCREEGSHAFKDQLSKWETKNQSLQSHIFYDKIENRTKSENVYEGRVDLAVLEGRLAEEEAEYYLCGPSEFIRKHYEFLTSKGVQKELIHFEEFGPASLQLN